MIDQIRRGRLPFKAFPHSGFVFAHVDDVADGIIAAYEKGRIGEAYILGGEKATLGELLDKVSVLSGRKPPRFTIPTPLIKLAIPVGPVIGKLVGLPPNFAELIRGSDGVTYYATHAKAARELGYAPRDLDTGLTETLAAA
jgi:dihydroflavonol-4-reductase